MSWLRKLLGLCEHRWARVQIVAVYETWDGKHYPGQIPTFHKHILQCKICGDEKVKRI